MTEPALVVPLLADALSQDAYAVIYVVGLVIAFVLSAIMADD